MSDEQRRALERSVSLGDVDARVRALARRVRAGELPRERVELAAWCGDETAAAVMPVGELPDRADEWLTGAERFGREATVQMLAAARQATLPDIASAAATFALTRSGPWVRALEHLTDDARELRARIGPRIAAWALDDIPIELTPCLPVTSTATGARERLDECGLTLLEDWTGGTAARAAIDHVLGRAVTVQMDHAPGDLRSQWSSFIGPADPTRIIDPHVRRVLRHGISRDGWLVFLSCEIVHGTPLDVWLEDETRPLAERLAVVRGLARGVAACHAAGRLVVNLSAGNVTLRADGTPVIEDAGFLAWSSSRVGPELHRVGVAFFLGAPEVLQGGRPTSASDVFALAALAHQVFSGSPPFGGTLMIDVMRALLVGNPQPLPPAVPRPLALVIRRALAREPGNRPPFAELLAVIEEVKT